MQAPPDVLPRLVERVTATSAGLAAHLARFEGLHILMFSAPDIDAAAARLSAAGVGHGGVNTPGSRRTQRRAGPRGRRALRRGRGTREHDRAVRALPRPSGQAGRPGTRVFDLAGARLIIVPESGLAALLPGERPAALPALVACTVAVRDLDTTGESLLDNGIAAHRTPSGDLFVPAAGALGTAIVFH
ncbi:hypothetical protein JOM49_006862 [Amycolatopsis magusensis]|uniref:Glyoxalase-like domain-containing protein n=1 Tax=Amycolatopsis magusensis TaxID=882444 RepID=A0ABS4Q3F6_9PSEU|nr:hypothetical protein [Amycolatopsis magusensis]